MPSIDERVVELQFDNSDFSHKVSQTVGDLKTLDNALQLGGSAAGIKEVSGAINKIDMSPLISAAESVNNKFSTMRVVAATAISKITDTVMNAGKKIFTAIPNQIISGGWNRAANIAKAKFTFEGLAKETGDTWEDMSKAINYAVGGTAYTFDAAANAASSFYASGVNLNTMYKEGEEDISMMHVALRGISGIAAMTSSDYSDIARVFTTVAGNGRLMAQQLNQISARGINAAAVLAKAYHVSEGELREMVSRGEVDFQTFAKAMDDAFGAHAKEANKTFQGAFANIKAALSKTGELFAAPLMESMIPVLNGIRNMFSNFKDQLGPIVKVWTDLLNTLSPVVTQFFEGIAQFIKSDEFTKGMENIASKFEIVKNVVSDFVTGKPKFVTLEDWQKLADSPYLDMLKDKLVEIASASDENFKAMYDSYDSFEASLESGWLTKDIFSQAVNDLKDVAVGLDELGESAEITSGYLEECWQHVWEVERGDWGNGQERFDRLTEAGLSYHDIQGLVNHDLLGWDYTLEGLNTTLRESGKYTDEQIAALEAFAKELEEDGSSLQEFMNIFDSVDKMSNFELVMGTLGNVAEFLREVFVDVSTAFAQVFSGDKVNAFETFGDALHYWLERIYMWSEGLDAFGTNGNKIFTVAKQLFGYLKSAGSAVVTVITGMFDAGKKLLSSFEPLVPIVKDLITGFVELVTGVKDSGEEMSLLETIANGFSSAIGMAADFLAPTIQAFADWVTQGNYVEKFLSGLSSVISYLKPVFKSVGDSIKAAWDIAGPYVKKFSEELPDRLTNAFSTIKEFVTPMVETIGNALRTLFTDILGDTDVGSAFTDFYNSLDEGRGFIESFADLVKTAFDDVKEALQGFFDLFNSTSSGFDWADYGTNGGDSVIGKSLLDGLHAFNDEASATSEIVQSNYDGISLFLDALKFIGDMLQKVFVYFENMDLDGFDRFLGYFLEAGYFVVMLKAAKGFKDLGAGIKGLSGALSSLPNMTPWGAANSALANFGKAIRPGKFFEIALAISAVAVSIWLLSTVEPARLWNVIGAMAVLAVVIGALVFATSRFASSLSKKDALKMEQIGRSLVMFAAAIALVAVAALILEQVDPSALAKAAGIFIALVAGAKILSKGSKHLANAAATVLAFAISITLLLVPLLILAYIPFDVMVQGLWRLAAVMAITAISLWAIGKGGNLAKTGGAILGFAVALMILTGVVYLLGSMDPEAVGQGLNALARMAIILAGSLIILGGITKFLGVQVAGFTSLGAAALLLGLGLLAAAAAVWVLAHCGDQLKPALFAFGIMATIMAALVVVLYLCSAGLLVAGQGMLMFGAGVMLVAASLVVAAIGMGMLIAVLPTFGASLERFAGHLGRSATKIGEALGEAIVAFLSKIGEFAGQIAEAMWNMAKEAMSRLAQGFMDNVGTVVSKLSEMFKSFADAVSPHIPDFIASGVQIVVALIEGLASQLDAIVQSAFDLVISLINAISDALENNGVELRAACDHLVQSIIEFIIEFITGKETDLDDPSQGIGHAIVDGILGGFDLFGGDVLDKVGEFATNILDKIKGVFGIGGSGGGSSEAKSIVGDFMSSFETEVDKSKAPIGGAMQNTMTDFLSKMDPKAAGTAATGVTGAVMTGLGGLSVEPGKVVQNGLGVMSGILSGSGSWLSSTASYAAGGITNAFSYASGAATSSVSSMTSNVTGEIGKSATPIESSARSSILGYVTSISRASGQAAASARTVTNSVTSALKSGAGAAQSAGSALASKFAAGIRGGGGARGAASSVASSAAGAFRGYSAYGAGYDLVQGFANGIDSASWRARAAAYAVGSNALASLKKGAAESSPSRVAKKYGAWLTEGWILGMKSLKDESNEAAEDIGKSSLGILSTVADAISEGVDMSMDYNPMITPIVDLDNVTAASKAIGSMIDPGYGLGIGQYANSYGLYGAGGNTSSVVNNVSVALQYQAGSDANQMASDLASALTSKLNLEG